MQVLNRSAASHAAELARIRRQAREEIETVIGAAQAGIVPALHVQAAVYSEKEAQARAVIDLGVAAQFDDPELGHVADEFDLRGGTMIEAAQRILDAATETRDSLRAIEKVRLGANAMVAAAQTLAEAESAVVWCKKEIEKAEVHDEAR
jgi:hypothetical protein